ncbi:membrane protein containing [Rhodopirellula maiorica SM1]|uniref:Membrane protein containing n=1 Tax=Rhodopirellula maiorica SM1 TaxID=1265738 RepID=M5RKP7_9BACT|nr:DUF485 domain-containing protein [Rhodopirellula maiorica]EMI19766.1 membrane protein containing [Rhodopirellula maiorica SM1]
MPTPLPKADVPTAARQYNSRLGIVLFVIYLVLYAGFVFINAFDAERMETVVVAGLNLAIVYGFGLIIAAILMALLYGVMCRNEPIDGTSSSELSSGETNEGASR